MENRPSLIPFKKRFDAAFENNHPRRAHEISQDILRELAGSKDLLEEIILQNISRPNFFQSQRGNPVIAFDIFQNPIYTLVANVWIPLPGHKSGITHQSIHHHGNLLLTSAAAFGEGYQSILFKKDFEVDPTNLKANLEIDKFYQNKLGNIEFVDSFAPHVVFYPSSLSITFALWSTENRPVAAPLKSLPFIKNHKMRIKKALLSLGLGDFFQLNKTENYDFYVKDSSVFLLPERIKYPSGTNPNFLRAFFYILQEINFSQDSFLFEACKKSENFELLSPFLQDYKSEIKIENIFEPNHLGIEKVNLLDNEIFSAFPNLTRSLF